MKAGERDRVAALRLIADALQKDRKEGGDDEVAVLRRERKRRLEAAEAYRDGGSDDRAEAEEAEARDDRALPARRALRRGAGASWSTRRSPSPGASSAGRRWAR